MTDITREVYDAYLEALLATSGDEEDTDLATCEVADFTKLQVRRDITQLIQLADTFCPSWRKFWSPSQFGTDFLLTRNHHGTGFWDRAPTSDCSTCKRYYRVGQKLTAIAHTFCEMVAYVGDDGLVYVM